MLSNLDVARLAMHKSQNPDVRDFANTIQRALHKKSWAVIDRPYSLGCATVGALYERPRCIFCAKPLSTNTAIEKKFDLAHLGGTRHFFAAQFAHDQRNATALLASQDGQFTVFAWSSLKNMVHAHRLDALLI